MPHIVKADEFKKLAAEGKAKMVFQPKPGEKKQPLIVDGALAIAIERVAAAIAAGQSDQREAIMRALQFNRALHESMLGSLRPAVAPEGPWRVTVTKRDPLGRIAEVEFVPTTPNQ